MNTIKIGGVERELPVGVERLGEDDLYEVPFTLLNIADEDSETLSEYQWANPRRLGQMDGSMGRGFSKQDMEELYADIRDEGLLNPLICRWVVNEGGHLIAQVLDGERRYRCIDLQVKKDEKVWSRRDKSWLQAAAVHERIQCRVITGNDKEALKIAFMVSDRSVGWGEGATAKLIKKLRKCNCSDKEILELTKKSFQWLKEQDEICQLDDLTFNYLTDGKINRALALRLAKVEKLERRHMYLHAAYDDAVATHQEELTKADAALNKAEEKEELAEAELVEAQEKGDPEAVAEAKDKLEKTQERTQARRRQRSEASRPRGKTKNLRNAATKIAEESAETGDPVEVDDVATTMRTGKIRKEVETLTELIKNGGKDAESKEVADVNILEVLRYCYNHNILQGEEDIVKVLFRFKNLTLLRLKNQQQQVVAQADAQAESQNETPLDDSDEFADDDDVPEA